jgi:hypothetical protein
MLKVRTYISFILHSLGGPNDVPCHAQAPLTLSPNIRITVATWCIFRETEVRIPVNSNLRKRWHGWKLIALSWVLILIWNFSNNATALLRPLYRPYSSLYGSMEQPSSHDVLGKERISWGDVHVLRLLGWPLTSTVSFFRTVSMLLMHSLHKVHEING